MHSTPTPLLCMRRLIGHGRGSGSRLFSLFPAFPNISVPSSPACSSRAQSVQQEKEVCRRKKRGRIRGDIFEMRLTEMMICGTLPSSAMTFKRSTVSLFPTISSSNCGRYFSTLCVSPKSHKALMREAAKRCLINAQDGKEDGASSDKRRW